MRLSTRDLGVYLQRLSVAVTADVITGVTNAAPAVVTPTTIGSFSDGDIVLITGTGMTSIDDKYWIVDNIDVATFELKCSDASGEAAAATAGAATPYKMGTDVADNLVPWCLNSLGLEQPAADTIDLSTFCDTESTVGQPNDRTLSVGGPVDHCDLGHQEFVSAVDDGQKRLMAIQLPKNSGYVIFPVEMNQYSESYELNAAIVFTGGGIVKEPPSYSVCECPT